MPSVKPLILGAFLSTLVLPIFSQQAAPAADEKTPEMNELQKEFSNLPEQQRKDFVASLQEAGRLFNQKRVFETLEELHKASKIFGKSAETFNMQGSCYVEFRDFVKARKCFEEALKLGPEMAEIHFNIAEMEFVTRNWQACIDKMKVTLEKLPANATPTRRLVEFKIMLCLIALNKSEEANTMAEKYDPIDDDSPFYYYAQAALCYRDKDLINAEQWLQIANRVFQNPAIISPWQDTLIEFGYIESFYGGAQEAE